MTPAEIIGLSIAFINTGLVVTIWATSRNRDTSQLMAETIKVITTHLTLIDIALARVEERLKAIEGVMVHRDAYSKQS